MTLRFCTLPEKMFARENQFHISNKKINAFLTIPTTLHRIIFYCVVMYASYICVILCACSENFFFQACKNRKSKNDFAFLHTHKKIVCEGGSNVIHYYGFTIHPYCVSYILVRNYENCLLTRSKFLVLPNLAMISLRRNAGRRPICARPDTIPWDKSRPAK